MAETVRWSESDQFETIADGREVRQARRVRSAVGTDTSEPVPEFLRSTEVDQVLEVVDVRSQRVRASAVSRAARLPEISVNVEADEDAEYMLVLRQPSGALTFHDGKKRRRRARGKSGAKGRQRITIEFRAPVSISAEETVRRSMFGTIIDAIVDAVIVKVTGFIAEKAVNAAEAAIWSALDRKPGLFQVVPGAGLELKPFQGNMKVGPGGRALLFIHGTFSTTQGGFGDLAKSDFFARVADAYGDAIYGFDHYTVSEDPERNALELLAALPAGGIECDVITHSRGGLVLRNLVERRETLKFGDRFTLGHAALVASPNEGTPLATPGRWEDTIGWVANILDLFPPNPATSGLGMVAHWITWFVKVGVSAAEGLDSMNQGGARLRELQQPPSPPSGQYSALVSNYEPEEQVLARALDLGIDWFFDSANDLVVPTAGGWRIDQLPEIIPAEQIGVFGPGGNIAVGSELVSHVGFFARQESQDFLVRALRGEPQNLPLIDPAASLPTNRRSAAGGRASIDSEPPPLADRDPTPAVARTETEPSRESKKPTRSVSAQPLSSVFELIVLDPDQIEMLGLRTDQDDENDAPFLYAAYGGARVTVPFRFKKAHVPRDTGDDAVDFHRRAMVGEITERWGNLFGFHRKVRDYLDGVKDAGPLPDADLKLFGELLFKTLFPDEVRRLYDVARARERDQLFVIFTSMIPWVFDMPWEFARDAERGTFLATEDVHFIRNVLTPTPVERLEPHERLKMLVAIAEPRDLVPLSAAQEVARLRHALGELSQEGLIEFETLEHATANKLHRAIATGQFDVVHFIGHGYWDRSSGDSGLVLEDDAGISKNLGGRPLREILSNRGTRLVFLNACDTGRGRLKKGAKTESLAGVAQDLFGSGVPNVIANQFPVGDKAAVAFARSIYEYLAQGKSVAQAVREARIAANYEKGGENMDWAIPVVYARDPEDRFVRME